MSPFGELLAQFRSRKPGLSQAKLARAVGYDPAVIARMAQGKLDLTGPTGRAKVVRIIIALREQGVLRTVDEANALLAAANMPPLFAGLPEEATLLQTLEAAPFTPSPQVRHRRWSNLPAPLTSLVGREDELPILAARMKRARLLTLVGAGGIGKTRLAIALAGVIETDFADGLCWVDLAPLQAGALVAQAIARAPGIHESSHLPPDQALKRYLRDRQLILIVDNCEHLLDAVAPFVESLLLACPKMKVLATSREPLGLMGEQIWMVNGLALPETGEAASSMDESASVRLFCERAADRSEEFVLTAENASAVAQICRRVDGIPLAIELMASALSTLDVGELAERVREGLPVPEGNHRTATARHRTMQAALDWSHDRLAPAEQHALARLSVFAGGWTLDAAQALLDCDRVTTLRRLNALMQTSFVIEAAQPANVEEKRYRILEPVRQYAAEHLRAVGEWDAAMRAHSQIYLALATQAEPHVHTSAGPAWLARLAKDQDNFQAALEWNLGPAGDAVFGLRLANSLQEFWRIRGNTSEGAAWLERALHCAGDAAPASLRAQALAGAGTLMRDQGHLARAQKRLEEALALFSALSDRRGMAYALNRLGTIIAHRFNTPEEIQHGVALLEESLSIYQPDEDDWIIAAAQWQLAGILMRRQNDLERARPLFESCLRMAERMGDAKNTIAALAALAEVERRHLRFAQSLELAGRSIARSRQINDTFGEIEALLEYGETARMMRDFDRARTALTTARSLCKDIGVASREVIALRRLAYVQWDRGDYAQASALLVERWLLLRDQMGLSAHPSDIAEFAALACLMRQHQTAARLFGAADAMRAVMGLRSPLTLENGLACDTFLAQTQAVLNGHFVQAWDEGRAMTVDDAIALALAS